MPHSPGLRLPYSAWCVLYLSFHISFIFLCYCSAQMRFGAVQRLSPSQNNTATAWVACMSSSPAHTRDAGHSFSAETWRLMHATASTGVSPATWAVVQYSPTALKLSTTVISSWDKSTKSSRGTTGQSLQHYRGRWRGCKAQWPTWKDSWGSSVRAWRGWMISMRWRRMNKVRAVAVLMGPQVATGITEGVSLLLLFSINL